MVHLIFEFAEKLILPSMERLPSKLHFITGMRYDIFGIVCPNLKQRFIFGLPEGHWPGTTYATSVLSMLMHVIDRVK